MTIQENCKACEYKVAKSGKSSRCNFKANNRGIPPVLSICLASICQLQQELASKFVNKLASKFVPAAKIKAANKDFLNLQYKGKEYQNLGINLC